MTVVRSPLQTLVRARAKVAPQGNLLHLRHLERGEQILQQSNTALCVQFFFRMGRTDSAAKQHSTLCTGVSERGEQILKQSNTTRCVQFFFRWGDEILQQNNTTLCVQGVSERGEQILQQIKNKIKNKKQKHCRGFSKRGLQILRQNNTTLCV